MPVLTCSPDHQRQIGTRAGRRALSCFDQAVAFWRWVLDGVTPDRLAVDCGIGRSTAHPDVNEALSVVAKQAPSLHGRCRRRGPPGTPTSTSTAP